MLQNDVFYCAVLTFEAKLVKFRTEQIWDLVFFLAEGFFCGVKR